MSDPHAPGTPPRQFWGKHRGIVFDNVDPELLGRLLVAVPAVPSAVASWAWPCSPFAGPELGFFVLPPIGANVWVEFEGGDPNHPIWTGCFWAPGETPLPAGPPGITVFRTLFFNLVIVDEEGVTLTVIPPEAPDPIVIAINAAGIKITVPTSVVSIGQTSIQLAAAPAIISVNQETGISIVDAETISMEAPDIGMTGNVTIEGPVEVTGAVNITGVTSIVGATTIDGAFAALGEANVGGALTAEGEVNVAGALTAEGEVNIAGALTVEGGEAILGGGTIDGAPIL